MTDPYVIPEPTNDLIERSLAVKRASTALSQSSNKQRQAALLAMANSLEAKASEILKANMDDVSRASNTGLGDALLARLKLSKSKLEEAIQGVRKVSTLPDPIGLRQLNRELYKGLSLERVTVPLGVLGVIFESRPDAVMQIASLAIRSGNGAILKGGSEASFTNEVIVSALQHGLKNTDINSHSLCLLTTRNESLSLLRLEQTVDLIIPRGSNQLVRFIQENTRIPVLGHADGICHLYVDSAVDLNQALSIAIDSKCQYPAACNAIETLLVHEAIAPSFLPIAVPAFHKLGVSLVGDEHSNKLGVENLANESDWSTEYLDLKLSIKIVSSIEEALEHIRCFGSKHTDAIVTNDNDVATKFLLSVDSAGVYHNCSTRFADGFRYGFGAEVGISTQTLPPRGPVGLEGLVTYKYFLRGDGHLAKDFASGEKDFTHVDLPL
mgnify:CR=1 FL=1